MSNFAIIECGGKQYGVTEGDTIRVESLPGDEGDTLEIDTVKLLSLDGVVTLGGPNVKGASVSAQVVSKGKAKKVIVFIWMASLTWCDGAQMRCLDPVKALSRPHSVKALFLDAFVLLKHYTSKR